MEWNNGKKRAEFEREQAKLRAEYVKAGMTEQQIQSLYDYDLKLFNTDRREKEHTQRLDFEAFEDAASDEGQNPLLEKFSEKLTVEIDYENTSRYGWVESIENERLAKALKRIELSDLELLTEWLIDGFTMTEIAELHNKNKSNISRRITYLKTFLKKFL